MTPVTQCPCGTPIAPGARLCDACVAALVQDSPHPLITQENQTMTATPMFPADTAVVAVDPQRGFCPGDKPGYGELPAPDGAAVGAPLARLAARARIVAASGDQHPADHTSFTAQGGPWNTHCVTGTDGARFLPEIEGLITDGFTVAKGTDLDTEAYSAFAGDIDLAARLRDAGITRLIVGGLVTNVCVHATVMDALDEGFDVIVAVDACRAIDGVPGVVPTEAEALEQMREAGATLATTDELLGAVEVA